MKKFSLINLFILVGNVGVPGSAIALALLYPQKPFGWIFTCFIIFHSFERVWETFFTSKERKARQFHGDWTLALVTLTYIILCLLIIFEFFISNKPVSSTVTFVGVFIYLIAFRIRWWGMKSLGSQWSIHAVGAIKLKHYRLLRLGAYRYIRHPVYFAIMLEELSLPLISNAFFSLSFAIAVCIPLVIIRAIFEEKSSIRKFGKTYLDYKNEVGMFFPIQLFRQLLLK